MARNRVMLETRRAKLSEEFGYNYACKLFGKEAIDSLPKLERGENKGKPKGFLIWRKAMTAGYVAECCGPCQAGGLVDAWVGEFFGTLRGDASVMMGQWCGRKQSLAGSRSVLTQQYRDYDAASRLADIERQKQIQREGAGRDGMTTRLTKPLLHAMISALNSALAGDGFDGGDFDGEDPKHFERALMWAQEQIQKREQGR